MCEFCIKHGEGKKWYLEMKHYSEILFNEELTTTQKEIAGVNSRLEYTERSFVNWLMPAMGIIPKEDQPPQDAVEASENAITENQESGIDEADPSAETKIDFTAEEIVACAKIKHFGQVVPIEDVDTIIDMSSSITRLPCGCRYLSTGKTDKRYCFGLGVDKTGLLGKYPETSASLEVLDKREAKEFLHKYDDEGLIHTIWTGITPYVEAICNCDRDCGAYNGSYVEGYPSSFFRGGYLPSRLGSVYRVQGMCKSMSVWCTTLLIDPIQSLYPSGKMLRMRCLQGRMSKRCHLAATQTRT